MFSVLLKVVIRWTNLLFAKDLFIKKQGNIDGVHFWCSFSFQINLTLRFIGYFIQSLYFLPPKAF